MKSPAARQGAGPSEAFVAWVWQDVHAGRCLRAQDGCNLEVIYPGARGFGRGPDFRGALVALEGTLLASGDVEVHVRRREWAQHKHAEDAAYGQTLLHVVWESDASPQPGRPDGTPLLEIALEPYLRRRLIALRRRFALEEGAARPGGCLSPAALERVAELAGLERFFEKSAVFEAEIEALGPDESLYRWLMRALGYTANQAAFLELAEALPFREARALALSGGATTVETALLLRGGFTEGKRLTSSASPRFSPTRPENAPCRRLAAAAVLVTRWAASGPGPSLEAALRASEGQADNRSLVEELRVSSPSGYWCHHFAPGRPLARPFPWLLGRGRATEMAVSVVLPWLHAAGQAQDRPDLSRAALAAYLRQSIASTNQVVEEARRLLARERAWRPRRACQQQGLILLSRRYLQAPQAWRLTRRKWVWRPDLVFEPARVGREALARLRLALGPRSTPSLPNLDFGLGVVQWLPRGGGAPTAIPDNPNWHRLRGACVFYRERWSVEDEPGDEGCLLLYQAICLQNTPPLNLEEERKCMSARGGCWRLLEVAGAGPESLAKLRLKATRLSAAAHAESL